MSGLWVARVGALALVVVAASLVWRTHQGATVDERPIWIKPGEYLGPPDSNLDQAQVEAITERAQLLKF